MDDQKNNYYTKYVILGDTAIGNHTYKKLQVQPYCDSLHFIRDTDTIYSVMNDPFHPKMDGPYTPNRNLCVYIYYKGNKYENLLYKWSGLFRPYLQVTNDSTILAYYKDMFTLTRTATQRIPVQWYFQGPSHKNNYWIERVGSAENLLYNNWHFFYTYSDYLVRCVKDHDTIIYSNGPGNNCSGIFSDFKFTGQCLGDTTRFHFLTCENVDSIFWDFGEGTTSRFSTDFSPMHYYENEGTYLVTMRVKRDSDSLVLKKYVIVKPVPQQAFLGNDTTICGSSYILDGKIDAYRYFWSTGDTTRSITISQSGKYAFTGGHNSCIVTDTIDISLLKQPIVALADSLAYCSNDALTLNAGNPNYDMKFHWSNGDSTFSTSYADTGRYWLKITNGICKDSGSFYVSNKQAPEKFGFDSIVVCDRGSFDLRHAKHYDLNIGGQVDSSFSFTRDTIVAIKISHNGCITRDTVSIFMHQVDSSGLLPAYLACKGEIVNIDLNANISHGIRWSNGDTSRQIQLTPQKDTTLQLLLSNGLCSLVDSTTIKIKDKPPVRFADSMYMVCSAEMVAFAIPHAQKFKLGDSLYIQQLIIRSPGSYYLTIIDSNNCETPDSLHFSYHQTNFPNSLMDTFFCPPEKIQITFPVGFTYKSPTAVLVNQNQLTFENASPHEIYLTDLNGCSDTIIFGLDEYCDLIIPNSFTPNEDGKNDVFKVSGITSNFKMEIFNRWGEQIFISDQVEKGWDGKFRNVACETGIYHFVVTYKSSYGRTKILTGAIQLLR